MKLKHSYGKVAKFSRPSESCFRILIMLPTQYSLRNIFQGNRIHSDTASFRGQNLCPACATAWPKVLEIDSCPRFVKTL